MSLVFPNALAAKTTNLALARGSFWFGMVCLAAVFASLVLIQADRGTARAWLVFVAIVLIALSGVLVAVLLALQDVALPGGEQAGDRRDDARAVGAGQREDVAQLFTFGGPERAWARTRRL